MRPHLISSIFPGDEMRWDVISSYLYSPNLLPEEEMRWDGLPGDLPRDEMSRLILSHLLPGDEMSWDETSSHLFPGGEMRSHPILFHLMSFQEVRWVDTSPSRKWDETMAVAHTHTPGQVVVSLVGRWHTKVTQKTGSLKWGNKGY